MNHYSIYAILAHLALLVGCSTVQIEPVGEIRHRNPDRYNKTEKRTLAAVEKGNSREAISIALALIEKKYPELEVRNLELKMFQHSINSVTHIAKNPFSSETVIVYFRDKESLHITEEDETHIRMQATVYRVEYDITRSDGRSGVFISDEIERSRKRKTQ